MCACVRCLHNIIVRDIGVCVCTLNEHTKRSNFDADKLTLTGNEWARARITIPQTDYGERTYITYDYILLCIQYKYERVRTIKCIFVIT